MDGKTVVVTGASSGIGRAVAIDLAEAGAHVVICARVADELEDTAEEIRNTGGTVTTKRVDVRDEFDVEHLMEIAAAEGGEIDGVVANAGVYHGETGTTPLHEESYTAFDDHMQTNGRGVFATLREAIPHLAPDARLLVTSGVVARGAAEGVGSYAVSKAAAEAVVRGFSADTDYDVCVIDPGLVETGLTGASGHDPADVAEQFRWALEEAPADELDGGVIDRRTFRAAQE